MQFGVSAEFPDEVEAAASAAAARPVPAAGRVDLRSMQFFTVDLTASPARVMVNHVSFDGVSTGTPPHTEHPTFNATNNNGMTALSKCYDLTTTAVTAGNCGTAKLNPPAQ